MLDKKDMIHIAAEVVVIIGVTSYFYIQNKNLSEQISVLSAKLEEQDKLIKKHDEVINQLVGKGLLSYQQPPPGYVFTTPPVVPSFIPSSSPIIPPVNSVPTNSAPPRRKVQTPPVNNSSDIIPEPTNMFASMSRPQIIVATSYSRDEKPPIASNSKIEEVEEEVSKEIDLDEELSEELKELA